MIDWLMLVAMIYAGYAATKTFREVRRINDGALGEARIAGMRSAVNLLIACGHDKAAHALRDWVEEEKL